MTKTKKIITRKMEIAAASYALSYMSGYISGNPEDKVMLLRDEETALSVACSDYIQVNITKDEFLESRAVRESGGIYSTLFTNSSEAAFRLCLYALDKAISISNLHPTKPERLRDLRINTSKPHLYRKAAALVLSGNLNKVRV